MQRACCAVPCCVRAVVATRDAMHKKMLSVIEQLLARGATKHLLVVSSPINQTCWCFAGENPALLLLVQAMMQGGCGERVRTRMHGTSPLPIPSPGASLPHPPTYSPRPARPNQRRCAMKATRRWEACAPTTAAPSSACLRCGVGQGLCYFRVATWGCQQWEVVCNGAGGIAAQDGLASHRSCTPPHPPPLRLLFCACAFALPPAGGGLTQISINKHKTLLYILNECPRRWWTAWPRWSTLCRCSCWPTT